MRFRHIATLKLKEMTRNMGEWLVPIIFPLFFMVSFKWAFSASDGPMGIPFFDYLTPGMVVFALLLLAVSVSSGLAREVDKGTLARLRLTPMTSFDLLFGALVVWSAIGVVQVLILFATGVALGFTWEGGWTSLAYAAALASLAGVASVALGLLVAAFSKTEGNAGAFTTLLVVPIGFLVGSFMPMPTPWLNNVLPWAQAIRSLRAILNAGMPISSQIPGMLSMTIQILVLLAVGMVLYSRMRLRAE